MSYVLLILVPFLAGFVIGFLLLDQRDDGTLIALQVTPLSLPDYLGYRLMMPVLLSTVMTLLAFPLAALVEIDFVPLLITAVGTAPQAPIFALFLAAFAQNKVQGFALMKVSGVLLLPPIVAHFVPFPWHLAFGLVPTYWPAWLFWAAQAGDPTYWTYLVVGFGYQVVLLWLLLRRFDRVIHQ